MTRTSTALLAALLTSILTPAALAGTIGAAEVTRPAPDRLTVRWSDPDPVDVYASDRADATPAQAKLVSSADRDGLYEAPAGTARTYFLLKDRKSGAMLHVAERLVPLDHGSNFRDVGGYATADGKHVRWGLIYRSGATPLLTDADLTQVNGLHLANIVDLRSSEERALAPTRIAGVPYNAVGYSMASIMQASAKMDIGAVYRNFPTQLAPQIRILFARMLGHEGAVEYNCSAGQDRTGFTTAILLSALGVPRDTIYADYLLSTGYRHPEYEMPKIDVAAHPDDPAAQFFAKYQANPAAAKPKPLMFEDKRPYLTESFAEIERRWGSVDAYLEQELGLGPVQRATLRAIYLE